MSLPKVTNNKAEVRAITYKSHATPLELTTLKVDVPSAEVLVKPSGVLIRTKIAALNPADVALKSLSPDFDHTPIVKLLKSSSLKGFGSDFAGVVVQAGSQVTGYKSGDEVYGNCLKPFSIMGSFRDFLFVDPTKIQHLAKIPKGMTFAQAASLPVPFGTAYQLVKRHDNLKDANVLVLGGGTCVGAFATQLAKYQYGAKNIVTTCSSASSPRSLSYGAIQTIDYSKGKAFELQAAKEIVAKIGKFDLIFDAVRDDSLINDLGSVLKGKKEGGKYVQVIGGSTMAYEKIGFLDFMPRWVFMKKSLSSKVGLSGHEVIMGRLDAGDWGAKVAADLWGKGRLDVPIDCVLNYETESNEALEKVGRGWAKGKVLVEIDERMTSEASHE